MHFKLKNLVVSMVAGTAMVVTTAPATLLAITVTGTYHETAASTTAEALPQAITALQAEPAEEPEPEATLKASERSLAAKPAAQKSIRKGDNLDRLIDKLAMCESSGNPRALNPNDAGSPSYGLFQYKVGTWKAYLTKYGMAPETHAELMDLIYDGPTQRKLTRHILQEPGGWKHWKNCSRKVGLDKI